MSIEEFCKIDTNFNKDVFISITNNIFVKLLTSIMLDELDTVDHFISDDVYNWAISIINTNKSNNTRQMYDELNVKDSVIQEIEVNENVYTIKVFLQSRYMDYIINLDDGSCISGDNTSRVMSEYMLTFEKKVNALESDIVKKCPGCSASINVNESGKCIYCGATFNQEDYDWVLTKLNKLN